MSDSQAKKVNIHLILDRVMVKVDEPETQTAAGIYIPDTSERRRNTGIVVAKGEKCSSSIEEGDRVLFYDNAGTTISHEGETYEMFTEGTIWGKIPN